jgi:hypothetical protein
MATIPEPLFFRTDGNLQKMTSTQISDIVNQAISAYAADPLVQLVPVGIDAVDSAIALGPIVDTRLRSGAAVSGFVDPVPNEASTPEPETFSVHYYLNQVVADSSSATQPTNPLPLYRRPDGQISSMTPTDFMDTFIVPAIDRFLLDSNEGTSFQGGTYVLNNSTTLADHTLASSNAAYSDTRADTTSYTSAQIGVSGTYQDHSTTINNYYLMKKEGPNGDSASFAGNLPAFYRTDGNIQAYTLTSFNQLLRGYMRYKLQADYGSGYDYSLTTGNIRGTGVVDTRLTGGSGVFTSVQVSDSDYRAQEFPDGTPTSITTTYLRMKKRGS